MAETVTTESATNKGQVLATARGNLVSRLSKKPLYFGELFIQTKADTTSSVKSIYDIATGTYLTRLDTGDLFAGANSSTQVYRLGSGSALKWGGLLTDTIANRAALTLRLKQNPETVYMYNGYNSNNLYSNTSCTYSTLEPTEYSDTGGSKWENSPDLEPGDLIFYSSVCDQVVTIPMSYAVDKRTLVSTTKLTSSWFKKVILAGQASAEEDDPSLNTFFNYVVNHYQYLTSGNGWEPVTSFTYTDSAGVTGTYTYVDGATKSDVIASIKAASTTIDTDSLVLSVSSFTEDGDGYIHYIPASIGIPVVVPSSWNGVHTYNSYKVAYPGDVILSPTDGAGGYTHSIISLVDSSISVGINTFPGRVDDYATNLWASTDAELSSLQDYIKSLFTTKVDIDPATKKIISSQLPDWLLGAPKYQGTCGESVTTTTDSTFSSETTLNDFMTALGIEFNTNEDNNSTSAGATSTGDSDSDTTETTDWDTVLETGEYWIYEGSESLNVTSLVGTIFSTVNADDADATDGLTTSLSKGDWIIWNGSTFDIIDNTSSFAAIVCHDFVLTGTPELKDGTRATANTSVVQDGAAVTITADTKEVQLVADASAITYQAPNAVINAVGDADSANATVLTNGNAIPTISSSGIAADSRIKITDTTIDDAVTKQTGFKVSVTPSGSTTKSSELELLDLRTTAVVDTETFVPLSGTGTNADVQTTTYTSHSSDSTIIDFGDVDWVNLTTTAASYYTKSITETADSVLYLPKFGGILATEQYVNTGFAITKALIRDTYYTLKNEFTPKGHDDWLQTVVTVDSVKYIYDSYIKQEFSSTAGLALDLFTTRTPDTSNWNENTTDVTYMQLIARPNFTGFSSYDSQFDYSLADGKVLNPSTFTSTTSEPLVKNYLPMHSGVLLNNNSVIDGGCWDD